MPASTQQQWTFEEDEHTKKAEKESMSQNIVAQQILHSLEKNTCMAAYP